MQKLRTSTSRKLSALMVQFPNGHDREPVYSAFWDQNGTEVRREVNRVVFWKLQDSAGEPTYSEPNYWSYS